MKNVISLTEVRRRRQRRARRAREEAEARALHEALAGGRMGEADLAAMVRLGIVTDGEDLLPCRSPSRSEAYPAWLARRHAPDAPAPDQVACPLLSAGGRPPCVEALARQPGAGDAQDPVVAAGLRPCVVLGRELFRAIMVPVWVQP